MNWSCGGLGLGLTCSNMLIAVRDSNKRNMNYEASQIKFRNNEALSITKSEYKSRSKVTVLYWFLILEISLCYKILSGTKLNCCPSSVWAICEIVNGEGEKNIICKCSSVGCRSMGYEHNKLGGHYHGQQAAYVPIRFCFCLRSVPLPLLLFFFTFICSDLLSHKI